MKVKTTYICEICNTEFETQREAERCEDSHARCLDIVGYHFSYVDNDRFDTPLQRFPDTLSIMDKTGIIVVYKRTEEFA